MRTRLLLSVTSVILVSVSSAPGSATLQEIETGKLVGAMRTLNTAEYSYKSENGRFATREELLNYLPKQVDVAKLPVNLLDPVIVDLRITTSLDSNGEHYQIGLRPTVDSKDKNSQCKTSLFSDDAGVIYVGTALGCAEK